MADQSIDQLTPVSTVGDSDLFVLQQGGQAKSLRGDLFIGWVTSSADGHGGIKNITKMSTSGLVDTYAITYADNTIEETTFTVTNGKSLSNVTQYFAVSNYDDVVPQSWATTRQTLTTVNKYLWSYFRFTYNDNTYVDTTPGVIGVYGDTGQQTYVWLMWSEEEPTADEDISDNPNNWIGIYVGTADEPPTDYMEYAWFPYKGAKGDQGVSIDSIVKTGTAAAVDIYTITYSDETTSTFNVTNGSSISSIVKTATTGLVDTYTVMLTNGQAAAQFNVTNAKSISSISEVDVTHAAGHTDQYRINFNDGDTFSFSIYNGVNGTGAVSTVDGLVSVDQNVTLLTFGTGAPTAATPGAIKSRYFDTASSRLYICTGIDTSGANPSYTWAGAGVTTDSAMSTTSTNPVQNAVLTGIIGTETLTTTAQTIKGAVNELKTAMDSTVTSIKATNITIATTDWVSDPDNTTGDFPMRATIAMTGVTSDMFPQVAFGVEEAMSGNYAPISKCGTAAVYIYAVEAPDSSITIPSVCVTV